MEYTEKYFDTVDEAFADEAFVAKLAKAESKEELKALLLNEKGIEIEDDTAKAAFEKVKSVRDGGELSVEDLENVAGGRFSTRGFINAGANQGAAWGTQLWGPGFGTMLGAVWGARIAYNILSGRC